MACFVVTGSNRGIGLGFVQALLSRGDTVFATCRAHTLATQLQACDPKDGRLIILPLDIGDAASIHTAAAQIMASGKGVDVLIHNAGIYSDHETLGSIGFEPMLEAIRINALGPLVLTEALLPALKRRPQPKIVAISSGYGSISANIGGFPYTYATSKATLNQVMRCIAHDLSGFITVIFNPGWVQTDMGGEGAQFSVEESVAGMLKQIDALTPAQNGRFYSHLGEKEPW
jgi:NAD(P)-dependent dehydrogenase (short-subunit alcohol dehydrogenase family)